MTSAAPNAKAAPGPTASVDLVLPAGPGASPAWTLGDVRRLPHAPVPATTVLETWLAGSDADWFLFWDPDLGEPAVHVVEALTEGSFDVVHGGLALGMGGLPAALDSVEPTWLLALDPPADRAATSWRLSLRCCLVRTDVLRAVGGLDSGFSSLEAAGLELGYRMIRRGAFVRHDPTLLPPDVQSRDAPPLPFADELLFVRRGFGVRWAGWAAVRAVLAGDGLLRSLQAFRRSAMAPPPPKGGTFSRSGAREAPFDARSWHDRIAVLIPTIERYPYLRNELEQLRHQTVRPKEVLIVDQTPADVRDEGWAEAFPDLPIVYVPQDAVGQCTGWNAALHQASADYVVFLGDDADAIRPGFLEGLCRTVEAWGVDVVGAVVHERGAEDMSVGQRHARVLDGFPIAMVGRAWFDRVGYMDLAFDRGARADQDLAVRLLRGGAHMVLNPEVEVVHLRAPRGGLRLHGARVTTYSSSRARLMHRHLPSSTEFYLWLRHFSPRQLREMIAIKLVGTLSVRGPWYRRVAKVLVGLTLLPSSLLRMRCRLAEARRWIAEPPRTPSVPPGPVHDR